MAKKKEKTVWEGKSVGELKKSLIELREKLWHYKSDIAVGKVKAEKDAREAKKDIARIMTALNAPKKAE